MVICMQSLKMIPDKLKRLDMKAPKVLLALTLFIPQILVGQDIEVHIRNTLQKQDGTTS